MALKSSIGTHIFDALHLLLNLRYLLFPQLFTMDASTEFLVLVVKMDEPGVEGLD
jgi:hypothetical protein